MLSPEADGKIMKWRRDNPTPSQQCKALGFNLTHVSNLTGVSLQTLGNWHRNKPALFAVVLQGVANNEPKDSAPRMD